MNMLFYALSVCSIAIFGLFSAGKSTLPVTTCKRNSTDYSACLKLALEEAWPKFVAGLPEFDLPTLDPLFFEHASIVFNVGEIRGELVLANVSALGLSKIHFTDVRTHFLDDFFRLEIDAQLPWLYLESAVKLNGTVTVFRVSGKGHFNETANDVTGTWDLSGPVVNDTWIVEHFRILPAVGKLKIYFDNLLDSGKEFNDFAVNFVNEYWPSLFRIILPIVSDLWDPWLTEFPKKIFSKVRFSEVFP